MEGQRGGRRAAGVQAAVPGRAKPYEEDPASEPGAKSEACLNGLPLGLSARRGRFRRSCWGPGSFSETFASLGCADENGVSCFSNTQRAAREA